MRYFILLRTARLYFSLSLTLSHSKMCLQVSKCVYVYKLTYWFKSVLYILAISYTLYYRFQNLFVESKRGLKT